MDKLLLHQITLWIAILLIPSFVLIYVRDIFNPKRKDNGKLNRADLFLNIWMAGWLGYVVVRNIIPAFAYHVMGVPIANPELFRISLAWDIAFLSIVTLFFIGNLCYLPGRPGFRKFWRKGDKLCN